MKKQNNEKVAAAEGCLSHKADLQEVLSLRKQLTDVGQFAYAGLCAVCLYRLYSNEWDKSFQVETLNRIVKHLEQTDQVKASLMAIMEGQGYDSPDPYLSVLQKEKALEERRSLLIEDLITVALLNGDYDARMRTLIKYLAWQVHVSWDDVERFEETMVEMLKEEEHVQTEEEIAEKKKRETKSKVKRFALIGLATVGGGAIIGLTGGLAAPLLAAGAGAVIGGAGAAALGSVAGVAIIGSLFGAAGAGLGAYKMKRRLGSLEEFEFEPLTEGNHLDITIAITGWLSEESRVPTEHTTNKQKFVQKSSVKRNTTIDFRTPWMNLANSHEQYCLRYESHYLEEMGKSMDYLMSFFMTAAAQEAVKYTILSGIMAAVAWPATLLSAASVIDNPWSVCAERSATCGKHLAEVLLSRLQGKRPVTLIGFSLGARVIYYCLEEMAKRKNCEGIIEEVVLLGAPVPGDPKIWCKFRRVVAGRIINGYCRSDWLLKFLYRTASVQFSIAGLGPIKLTDRRMHNVDLTDIVNGHTDYSKKIDEILKCVGIKTIGPVVFGKEATDLDKDTFEIVDVPPQDNVDNPQTNNGAATSKPQNTKIVNNKDDKSETGSSDCATPLSTDELCSKFQELLSDYNKKRDEKVVNRVPDHSELDFSEGHYADVDKNTTTMDVTIEPDQTKAGCSAFPEEVVNKESQSIAVSTTSECVNSGFNTEQSLTEFKESVNKDDFGHRYTTETKDTDILQEKKNIDEDPSIKKTDSDDRRQTVIEESIAVAEKLP